MELLIKQCELMEDLNHHRITIEDFTKQVGESVGKDLLQDDMDDMTIDALSTSREILDREYSSNKTRLDNLISESEKIIVTCGDNNELVEQYTKLDTLTLELMELEVLRSSYHIRLMRYTNKVVDEFGIVYFPKDAQDGSQIDTQ